MPNKLEALPTSKTITKDFNEGKTVMEGKAIIYTTEGEVLTNQVVQPED